RYDTRHLHFPRESVDAGIFLGVQPRRLVQPNRLYRVFWQTRLTRGSRMNDPFEIAVPAPRGDENCQFAGARRQACSVTQYLAQTLPAISQFRIVQGSSERPDQRAPRATDDGVEYSLLRWRHGT